MSLPGQYMIGKGLKTVTLTPATVSQAGVWADVGGSAVTLSTLIKALGMDINAEVERIEPVNGRVNNVPIDEAAGFNCSVIRVNNGTDPSPVRTLRLTYKYFKVSYVEGDGTSVKTIVIKGVMEGYRDGFQGKGEQIAEFNLVPVDDGLGSLLIT